MTLAVSPGLGQWIPLPAPLPGWLPDWWQDDSCIPPSSSKALPVEMVPGTGLWKLAGPFYLQLAGSAAGSMGPHCGRLAKVYACGHHQDHIVPDNIAVKFFNCHNIACPTCRKAVAVGRAHELVDQLEAKLKKLVSSGVDYRYFNIGTWSPAPGPIPGTPETMNQVRKELKQVMSWSGVTASFELLHMFRLSPSGKAVVRAARRKNGYTGGKWDFIIKGKHFHPEDELIELSPHFHCGWPDYLKKSEDVEERTGWIYKKFRCLKLRKDGGFRQRDRAYLVRHLSYVLNHVAQWGTSEVKNYENKTNRGYEVLKNLTWSGLFSSQKLKLAEGFPKTLQEPVRCQVCDNQLVSFEPSGARYWHEDSIIIYPDEETGSPLPAIYEILNGYSSGHLCFKSVTLYEYDLTPAGRACILGGPP